MAMRRTRNPSPPCRATLPASALGPLVLVAALFLAGQPASAESDAASASRFMAQEAQRGVVTEPYRARTPRLRPIAEHVYTRPAERRPQATAVTVSRPAVSRPAAQRIVVAVFGDRVGQALATGLQDREGDGATVLTLIDEEAGLSRPSFPTWLQGVRDRLAKPDHPAVAVMAIGTNDRQAMQGDTGPLEPGTPQWQALYASRIDATAKAFQDAHVPLIWVGLPPVRSDEAAADYVRINGVVRDQALRDGVTYVDSWEAFTDDAGRYSPVGPDVDGATAKLRRADGMGFTRAGDRKLASFVENDINRLARRVTPDAALASLTVDKARNFDQALQIDVNAQIRREAAREQPATGGQPTPAASASVASPTAVTPMDGPPASARRDVLPATPAAGPIVSLTAVPVSPGGQLAPLPAPGSTGTQQASLAPAGPAESEPPKPGRADDFSWPHH